MTSSFLLALPVALALAASGPAPAPAEPGGAAAARTLEDPRALARKVQAFYERTRDLEARFRQAYTYAGFGRRQTSSGTLRVKKPGMMRWDYEKPAAKTVAVKGSRLVQYEPEENQAYVDEAFDSSAMSAAVTFLLGKGDLLREFDVSLDGSGALLLRPKESDPRVESIALTVAADGQVTATRVVDGAGNANEIRFEDVRRNVGLPDAAFEVKLPRDVRRIAAPKAQ
ncbi:outer membrane lipoprotein carrier protein LolA [Anaeromyxobacter sp. K]|uniref:LolA family protein n=1 Tax=Anaeromyxobacter sp. (strain K) TaxID=447217 RepID=UPI00015F9D21|nr:outer membrane lipoprotein carrier protein LolA [Anaeromyxobacter sp. K]ACG71338.1 outer membrane lipoprotein carrier protein LolA [Anaeromyxobacter sp. K]